MSDELSELIEDYRNIVTDKYAKLRGDEIAKQAIIDYHDNCVRDAYDLGRRDAIRHNMEVYEKYTHLNKLLSDEMLRENNESFERNIRYDLWQAIKKTVEENDR